MTNNQTTASTTQSDFPYRRTSRHPSDATKAKISASLRGGGYVKTQQHCQHLSDSLKAYWRDDRNFPDDAANDWGDTQ